MPRQRTKPPHPHRVRSRQIYLKPGVAEDELLLAVWDACVRTGRPQQMFREMLLDGYRSRVERGLIPTAVMDDPDVAEKSAMVGVAPRRDPQPQTIVVVQPHPGADYPGLPPGILQQQVPPRPAPPSPRPTATPAPPTETETPNGTPRKRRGLSPELM